MTSPTAPTHDATLPPSPAGTTPRPAGRRMIDAPVRAFHWLFALSFAGAWLTAESERWRDVHITLGYAFGGLLLFRVIYGLIGPRQARLSMLWRRVSGFGGWWRQAREGRVSWPSLGTLAMGAAMLLLLALAAPVALSGYLAEVDWLGLEDAMEEAHEWLANAALTLVLAHLALILVLSLQRRRNLARPMWTGRVDGAGPDIAKANHGLLAMAVISVFVVFVAWSLGTGPAPSTGPAGAEAVEHGHRAAEAGVGGENSDGDEDGDDD
ncbi:cytochrome b/b6 domain-containing protein [Ideonella sp. DXS29W]|uniref:Cytochrome b/b6 domain-containing protein n=1 Tax=Ideonella lacteola TaxID=2984193 RepID=A0ABU9BY33_9BURK